MKISIVGSGNIAHFFAKALYKAHFPLCEIIARNEKEGKKLACEMELNYLNDFHQSNADIFILALPDNILLEYSAAPFFQHKKIIYCSGALETSVFSNTSVACLWPIYSINKESLPKEKNIPFMLVTEDDGLKKVCIKLAQCMTNHIEEISNKQKSYLHLCAVLVNNFPTHLFAQAEKILNQQNLNRTLLLPIMEETFTQIKDNNAADLQTGPAKRKDSKTMQKHLELLQKNKDLIQLYKNLSESISNFEP